MSHAIAIAIVVGLAMVVAIAVPPADAETPFIAASPAVAHRIVSLNVCTDQFLVAIAPAESIRALSWLAVDPTLSLVATRAKAFASLRGTAEEVLALDPDLVIAGPWTTPATIGLLRRLGQRVVLVDPPTDARGISRAARQIAVAIGGNAPAVAEAALARMQARLAAAEARVVVLPDSRSGRPPTALLYQIGGHIEPAGSLMDEALRSAGFVNAARALEGGRSAAVSLEQLAVTPPDLIVLGHAIDNYETPAADNLRHPVLRGLLSRRPHITLSQANWLCGTLEWAATVEKLVAEREKLAAQRVGNR